MLPTIILWKEERVEDRTIVPSRSSFSDLAFFKEICSLSYTCRYDGTYYGIFLTYELDMLEVPFINDVVY